MAAAAAKGESKERPNLIRKAFVMSVRPEHAIEYERRHSPIWTELQEVLKSHGAHNYSIWLHPTTHQLFAYVEIESESKWSAVADSPIVKKWWRFMSDLMPSNADHSPISQTLKPVFYLP